MRSGVKCRITSAQDIKVLTPLINLNIISGGRQLLQISVLVYYRVFLLLNDF